MKWIRIGLLNAFVFGAVALLLFGPRPNIERAEEGVVIINYWEKWGGREGAQMRQIVEDFNATKTKNKHGQVIKVNYLTVSSVNIKVMVATAAQVPPDVAGIWDYDIPQYGSLDALLPLDEWAAEVGITEDYYKPVYWEGCCFEGKLYALVSTPWVTALHWNKELFEKAADKLRAAGLDPTRPPRTIEELDRYAEVLTTYSPSGDQIEQAGYMPSYPLWLTGNIPYWFGATQYDPIERKILFDSPEALAGYEWIRSYSEKYGKRLVNKFQQSAVQGGQAQDPFIIGTLAMQLSGPWVVNQFEQYRPTANRWRMSKAEEAKLPYEQRKANYLWGAAPFPSADGKQRVAFTSADVLAIPRGAKHPEEAFAFIAYVNRRDVMEKICSLHGKNSPLAEVSPEFIENHSNPYIDVFESLASSPNVHTAPDVPILPKMRHEMSVLVERVYLMTMEPADALRESQQRLQSSLDRFLAIQQVRKDREAGAGT